MRFDKRSRKINKKKKKKKHTTRMSFWWYLLIGLLFIAFYYFILYQGHEKELDKIQSEKIREDMDKICYALILYYQENDRYPSAKEGLSALISTQKETPVSDGQSSSGSYLERIPKDPWGIPYGYKPSTNNNTATLFCWGADRMPGGTGEAADVIREGCRPAGLSEG